MEVDHLKKENFLQLRDFIFARLAAYNARRVGEVTFIKIKEARDGLEGCWFHGGKLISSRHFVIYVPCKNSGTLVSLMVPYEDEKYVKPLMSPEIRELCGVSAENDFVFPSSKQSKGHIDGSHIFRKVASEAGVNFRCTICDILCPLFF